MNTPMFQEAHRGPLDWQSAQNLLSSSSSRLARTAWYRSTSFTDLPVMARVPAGAEGDAPSSPPETLPRSVGEDSRFPAQGYLLSGAEPSSSAPRPFSGQLRPPPSAAPQQPLSAAPPGGLRERLESRESCRTRDIQPMQRWSPACWVPGTETTTQPPCLSACAASRTSVSQAAAACSATTPAF